MLGLKEETVGNQSYQATVPPDEKLLAAVWAAGWREEPEPTVDS
ncbi:hypothetical protein MPNT_80074 [Candidatus Methylacidithermus pantelleriae]|uniref:Uncharacterized protein n=1 Tax=Candidatus Methylacidithermus pantelleriae TaxID=2744239 RepID=A0A8J2BNH6_9BACT|nr:hypothetical protein MPNT_80074 [Candidatus Methylacidithermus pantelleriae]